MSTWIYILIGIVILSLLIIRIINKAKGLALLKIKIGTAEGINYKLQIEKVHPETKEIEYVRLVLNFISKILFVIESKHNYIRQDILNFIKNVSKTEMTPNDVSNYLPKSITIQEGKPDGKVIEGILFFKDIKTRNIITKLPVKWFEYQLVHSVIILVKYTVEILDDFQIEQLKNSLTYMAEAYENGINPKEMKNMITLPNEAFILR